MNIQHHAAKAAGLAMLVMCCVAGWHLAHAAEFEQKIAVEAASNLEDVVTDEPQRELKFHFRILEAGKTEVWSEPVVTALEGEPFSFAVEQSIPLADATQVSVGQRLDGTAGFIKSGIIRLDVTLSSTTLPKNDPEGAELRTTSIRTIKNVKLGEVLKLRWRRGQESHGIGSQFDSVELSVHEVRQEAE